MITYNCNERKCRCYFARQDGTCRRKDGDCSQDKIVGYAQIEEPRPIEQATDLPTELTINGVVYVRKGE